MKKYKIPATIFLPTSYIGTSQWFWPDKIGILLHHYFSNGSSYKLKELIPLKILPQMRNIEDKIDSVIENCKTLSDGEINDVIDKLSKALKLNIPEKRVLLNWDEIKEMSKHRISFGSHSCNHKILTKLGAEELQNETAASMHVLKEKKINYVPVFCYPNGNFTDKIIEQVKASGYQAAVSTQFGFEDGFSQNLFRLKRIGIHDDISKTMPLFAYRLSGIEL